MFWQDEGYLLSKNNFNENSIIIEAFTSGHGKSSGIVYGGSSRKHKNKFQVGNKIMLDWKSKNENRLGYFTVELIDPISPIYFDNNKKTICILSACSILKVLLPENQSNKKLYLSFEKMLSSLKDNSWINIYIYWELLLIKELGFEIDFQNNIKSLRDKSEYVKINDKSFKIPIFFNKKISERKSNLEIKNALIFNRHLIIENFITPNKLKLPLSRTILENYFS
mgnify:CR=1 FL=1